MHNNGCNRWREATISLFQYYGPEDFKGLERIMKDQHIPPVQRNMVLKTYRASMGYPPEDADKEEEGPGKKKMTSFNPMDIGPEQIMAMTPGEVARWKQSLMMYKQAMETFNNAQSQIFGGPPGMMAGQYPPEIQAMMDEFKAMEEREKQKAMLEPLQRQLDQLTQAVQRRMDRSTQTLQKPQGGGDDFDDMVRKYLTINKLIDSSGGGKETDEMRAENA